MGKKQGGRINLGGLDSVIHWVHQIFFSFLPHSSLGPLVIIPVTCNNLSSFLNSRISLWFYKYWTRIFGPIVALDII